MRSDALRNQERVLTAARSAIADLGLDFSYHDIAHYAGVGVGTVYRHFPQRDDLVEALLVDILGQLNAQAREALTHPGAWEGFSSFFTSLAQEFRVNAGLSGSLEQLPGALVAAARGELLDNIRALVARAQSDGALAGDIHWQEVLALCAAVPADNACIMGTTLSRKQADRCIAIVLAGLASVQ
jgi:AcrR family transcriptional regulator